jgi:hypothetical protein
MSNDDSDDPNLVVIPVDPLLSDGDANRWPKTGVPGARFEYTKIDDSRWRAALAEMWVKETGALEESKFDFNCIFHFVGACIESLRMPLVGFW